MRELTGHKVNGVNDGLQIVVRDEPGHGGACHKYHVTTTEYPPPIGRGMSSDDLRKAQAMHRAVHDLRFQNGPIAEAGVNGITHEVLLTILSDRLEGFQRGPFACFENERALYHVREALGWLRHRTADRLARCVEGTNLT